MLIILGYFSGTCVYTIISYNNYEMAADSFENISKRSPISSLVGVFISMTVGTFNNSFICDKDNSISLYTEAYEKTLSIETKTVEYRKSSNSVYKDFIHILEVFESSSFCEYLNDKDCNLDYINSM